MNTLVWIILATFIVSLISLAGIIFLFFNEHTIKKITSVLVAFSAGSLFGGAFLHLIPEALQKVGINLNIFLWVILGFVFFFLTEEFLHWHNCRDVISGECKRPVTYLILIADSLHNFIDGIAIASSFIVDIKLGIITSLVCAAHELPQEFSDFSILIYGGWKKSKALLFNFYTALTTIAGGILTYLISFDIDTTFLLCFAAGNFIYVSASDLIPEMIEGKNLKKWLLYFSAFVSGIMLLYIMKIFI